MNTRVKPFLVSTHCNVSYSINKNGLEVIHSKICQNKRAVYRILEL